MVLIFISLIIREVEHLFVFINHFDFLFCELPVYMIFLVQKIIILLVTFVLIYWSSLCSLDTSTLLNGLYCTLFIESLKRRSFKNALLFFKIFSFMVCAFCILLKSFPTLKKKTFSLKVLLFMCRALFHLELRVVVGMN